LHIANEYRDAANVALEYGGAGLGGIPMHDRRTIATQGAEVSADFSIFEPTTYFVHISTLTASPDTLPPNRMPMRHTPTSATSS